MFRFLICYACFYYSGTLFKVNAENFHGMENDK